MKVDVIDEATPLVDARLLDGSRVNIITPPLAIDGPTISIRKFSKKTITLDTMAQQANISPEMATLLKVAARCRLNILISGGTGSGKTTLLNALSRLIDPTERTVTIEDAAELQLQQPHVVRLETRPPNLEGSGEITMRDLLRNALRMRPDRIILGEIRGAEALDVLQAMNTGHDGSMSTIHAIGALRSAGREDRAAARIGAEPTQPFVKGEVVVDRGGVEIDQRQLLRRTPIALEPVKSALQGLDARASSPRVRGRWAPELRSPRRTSRSAPATAPN